MLKIWRVEDDMGKGCYVGQDTEFFLERHKNVYTHPPPEQDPGIRRFPRPREISGFLTKEQAERWFSENELSMLEGFGFVLKEVEVDRITERSWYQCLAIKKPASLCTRLFESYLG